MHGLLRECGLNQFSPECGPFSLMCKAVPTREALNDFRGDLAYDFVKRSNQQMSTVALLMLVSHLGDTSLMSNVMPFLFLSHPKWPQDPTPRTVQRLYFLEAKNVRKSMNIQGTLEYTCETL